MATTITRKRRSKGRKLVAFGAFAGLLLQMTWATAHYPMLLANLGTTQSGVAVRTMVLCLHRANEQKIFNKLKQSRISYNTKSSKSHHAIDKQAPINRTSDDEQAPPSDDLCTFSIALTGNYFGNATDNIALPAPMVPTNKVYAVRKKQKSASALYLIALGRAPPA